MLRRSGTKDADVYRSRMVSGLWGRDRTSAASMGRKSRHMVFISGYKTDCRMILILQNLPFLGSIPYMSYGKNSAGYDDNGQAKLKPN